MNMKMKDDWGTIYRDIGAQPIINAIGSVTLLGGSTPLPEVEQAMKSANAYIPLIELQQKVGDIIAEMLDVPAAYITSGAGSALTLATAGFMAGCDDQKIQSLPDTTGMPNEIIIQKRQRYWYDRCLELAGAKLIDVGNEDGTTANDLLKAINEKTAVVHYPVYEQNPVDPNVLTLEQVIEIAAQKGKPVMVDSAGQIYPLENMGKYVRMGASFQAIAAKYLGAPQSVGLALGTKDVIDAIACHSFVGYETRRIRGIGRPHKIDRQEIVGGLVAVKSWMGRDHEQRLADAEQKSNAIAKPLQGIKGVTAKVINNIKGHHPFGTSIVIDPETAKIDATELVAALRKHDPPIWTRTNDNSNTHMEIHIFGMEEGEAEIVGSAIADILSS